MQENTFKVNNIFNSAVIVAALGYFVDVYDLVLFLIIGQKSLLAIGIAADKVVESFEYLLNVQMGGMLLGGIFWGILGDKKGRLSVLFGSIITYSLANIANGFVTSMDAYVILRFIAGFGLAGELGAGITLVSEIMSKENRGYGTMVVASIGVTGAVVAALVGKIGWQIAYWIGGGLGLSLLFLRIGVFESGMFSKMGEKHIQQGNFFALFKNKQIAIKYLSCILIGLPVWFIIGKLVGLSPQFAKELGVVGTIENGTSVMLCYSGLILGDLASGGISQYLKSRKRAMFLFYGLNTILVTLYLYLQGLDSTTFYILIFLLGFSVGFWAVFVTIASEQFGTNLRATVATTVPNFVRGSLILVTIVLNIAKASLGLIGGTALVAVGIMAISFFSLRALSETFGKELDYLEE
ncbi:MAG: MFS transporter [Opitutaceae bacterium]|nr:MFS transporter [Cytophagales bacterium]